MNITRIKISNFMGIEDADIKTNGGHTLAIVGENGQGKSSVLDAVRYCLLGFTDNTSRDGKSAKNMIRNGGPAAHVDVHFDSYIASASVYKDKPAEFGLVDASTGAFIETVKSRDDMWLRVGITKSAALATLNPAALLDSGELGDLVAEFVHGAVTPEQVSSIIEPHAAWVRDIAARIKVNSNTLDSLAEVGKEAFKLRTDVNRDLKQARLDLDSIAPVPAPMGKDGNPLTKDSLPGVRAGIAKYREQLLTLEREAGQASVTAVDTTAARERLAQAETDLLTVGTNAEQLEQKYKLAENAVTAANADIISEQQQVENLRKQRVAAANMGTDCACPTCGQAITGETRAALLTTLDAEITRRVGIVEKAREIAKTRAKEFDAVNAEYQIVCTEYTRLRETISAAKAEISSAPTITTTRPLADIEADIEETRRRIATGEMAERQLSDYLEYEARRKYVASLEAQHAPLDWACKALKDGEAIKALLEPHMATFASRVNAFLSLFGAELAIRADGKKVAFYFRKPGEPLRPLSLCSEGQRTLCLTGIACAFAEAGAPVLLDDLNHLDHVNRKGVIQYLRQRLVDTVIVAWAWQLADTSYDAVGAALAPVVLISAHNGSFSVHGARLAA